MDVIDNKFEDSEVLLGWGMKKKKKKKKRKVRGEF
jgi:hypothetical protein